MHFNSEKLILIFLVASFVTVIFLRAVTYSQIQPHS